MAAAEAEVAELRASAAAELQSARSTALQSLRSEVAAVAVGAASSVVGRRIDAAGAQSRIDGVLDGGAS
jgi:F0F1-type ATP synthase membrane subunit b/b'